MKETSKAYKRRRSDPFWSGVFKGTGIDIGSGDDPFKPEWFSGVTRVKTFDVEQGDAQVITQYVKGQCDFVHSSNCLEHIADPSLAIKEWWKLVKPGGYLVFTVPDEDLYEQGIWPSKWNPKHKHTFTRWKEKSWSPTSVNMVNLVLGLENSLVVRMDVIDSGFDREIGVFDQTLLGAEVCIEVVIKNTATTERLPGTFKHSGARGDIIYSLPTIQALGGGKLLLVRESGAYLGRTMSEQELEWMRELLVGECGITAVDEWNQQCVQFNLDKFRTSSALIEEPLAESHSMAFKVKIDLAKPWIRRERFEPLCVAPIIVSKTARYNGPLSWQALKPWAGQVAFLGFEDEWKDFKILTGMNVPMYTPSSYVEICRVLAGSKLFVGNQSFLYSLAEAMKVNRVQEAFLYAPNCLPHGGLGSVSLTEEWIRYCVCGEGQMPCLPVKSHSLLSKVRNRTAGRVLPKPVKITSAIANRPLVSIILVSDNQGWLSSTKESLLSMPSYEVASVSPADGVVGINLEAVKSRGDFVCVVEEGTKLFGTWFMEVLTMMNSGEAGAVGPTLVPLPMPHIKGGMIVVPRKAMEECGFFDPRAENPWLDFAMRLRQCGYTQRQIRSSSVVVRPS